MEFDHAKPESVSWFVESLYSAREWLDSYEDAALDGALPPASLGEVYDKTTNHQGSSGMAYDSQSSG